jgi:hypothetical protein
VAQEALDADFAQDALELLAQAAVHGRNQRVEEFDYRHLGAEAGVHRSHFQADDAAADNHQVLGHLADVQGLGAGDDALLVLADEGQHRGLGAGGDDDVFGFNLLRFAALGGRDADVGFASTNEPTP